MTAWEFTDEVSEEPLGRVVHHHFWFHPRLCVCLYACVAVKKRKLLEDCCPSHQKRLKTKEKEHIQKSLSWLREAGVHPLSLKVYDSRTCRTEYINLN